MSDNELAELLRNSYIDVKDSIKDLNNNIKTLGEAIQKNNNNFIEHQATSNAILKELEKDMDRNFKQHEEFYHRLNLSVAMEDYKKFKTDTYTHIAWAKSMYWKVIGFSTGIGFALQYLKEYLK